MKYEESLKNLEYLYLKAEMNYQRARELADLLGVGTTVEALKNPINRKLKRKKQMRARQTLPRKPVAARAPKWKTLLKKAAKETNELTPVFYEPVTDRFYLATKQTAEHLLTLTNEQSMKAAVERVVSWGIGRETDLKLSLMDFSKAVRKFPVLGDVNSATAGLKYSETHSVALVVIPQSAKGMNGIYEYAAVESFNGPVFMRGLQVAHTGMTDLAELYQYMSDLSDL